MNQKDVVRVRRCHRCQQLVKANAYGMWQHDIRCLRFDMRDRVVRGMVEGHFPTWTHQVSGKNRGLMVGRHGVRRPFKRAR